MLVDTHTHLFDEAFDGDRARAVARARDAGVGAMLLPAIDSGSHDALFALAASDPRLFFPMMGLHPTSVNDNAHWRNELELVERFLAEPPCGRFYGVGEVGLDMHWSRDHLAEQTEAFEAQMELALRYDLPLTIHTRDCWPEMLAVLRRFRGRGVRGVMHSFSGSPDDYRAVKECGDFLFGIGGPVTYKNSALAAILPHIALEDIVLESDAPYLPPVPFRGQRNESAHIPYICCRVAELLGVDPEQVARRTTANAARMFSLRMP